ncbi:MAG: anthranilate synthase/aminodeoxychorismate synthase-like glutamine amidotransferase [Marivirga sp.]|jgi:anthranilate synthase/aminodeoxychorismate synthase-like glutamine amidotransferase
MLLLVDNYDSFTYNLVDYFNQLGVECEVVKNDLHPSEIKDPDIYMGLVLSPGPGRPEDAGFLMEYIRFFERQMPIIGICLGHQAIALYYGGSVKKAVKPMHGKLSYVFQQCGDELCRNIPKVFEVVRYHSLIASISDAPLLINLAQTEYAELMILRHKEKLIYGLQYHPEAILTKFGIEILENWLEIIRRKGKLNSLILKE